MEADMNLLKMLGVIGVAAAISGCSSYGPGGIHYSTSEPSGALNATGATLTGGSGTVSGGEAPAAAPEEKEKRGNTPVGMDRDGHGPAAGAILDPTGAATRVKPY